MDLRDGVSGSFHVDSNFSQGDIVKDIVIIPDLMLRQDFFLIICAVPVYKFLGIIVITRKVLSGNEGIGD